MTEKQKFNPFARRKARYIIVQALYQWHCSKNSVAEIEAQFLLEADKKKVDLEYFSNILKAAISNCDELDQAITPYLDRPLNDLDPVELSILRLGFYELIHRLEIPYKVVINEAVELAKTFGAEEGHKFINGVMDKGAQAIRSVEVRK